MLPFRYGFKPSFAVTATRLMAWIFSLAALVSPALAAADTPPAVAPLPPHAIRRLGSSDGNVVGGTPFAPTFSADGRRLLIAGYLGITVQEAATGRILRYLPNDTLGILSPGVPLCPGGKRLVLSGKTFVYNLWDADTLEPIHPAQQPRKGPAPDFGFAYPTPDGAFILYRSADQAAVPVYDTATGREVARLDVPAGSSQAITFDAACARIAIPSGPNSVKIFSVPQFKLLATYTQFPKSVYTALFVGDCLVIQDEDGWSLWDPAQPKPRATLGGSLANLAVAPDGKTIAVSEVDHKKPATDSICHLRLVATDTGATIFTQVLDGGKWKEADFCFSPDSRTLAVAIRTGEVQLWDVAEHKRLRRCQVAGGILNQLAFSPDGKRLAAGGMSQGIHIIDVATGEIAQSPVPRAPLHGPILRLYFSANSKQVAALAQPSGPLQIFDTVTGRDLQQLPEASAPQFAMDADGWFAAVVLNGKDQTVTRLDLKSGLTATVELPHNQDNRLFGPPPYDYDATRMAGAHGNDIEIRAVFEGKLLTTLQGHIAPPNLVQLVPYHDKLVSGCTADGTVRIWDLQRGSELKCLRTMGKPVRLWISPGGRWLQVANTEGHFYFYDLDNLNPVFDFSTVNGDVAAMLPMFLGPGTVYNHRDTQAVILGGGDRGMAILTLAPKLGLNTLSQPGVTASTVLALAPDDRHLLTAGDGNKLQIWDLHTQRCIRQLADVGQFGGVASAAFSPDGKILATGGADGTVILWDWPGLIADLQK